CLAARAAEPTLLSGVCAESPSSLIPSLPVLLGIPSTILWPAMANSRLLAHSLRPSTPALVLTRAAHALAAVLMLFASEDGRGGGGARGGDRGVAGGGGGGEERWGVLAALSVVYASVSATLLLHPQAEGREGKGKSQLATRGMAAAAGLSSCALLSLLLSSTLIPPLLLLTSLLFLGRADLRSHLISRTHTSLLLPLSTAAGDSLARLLPPPRVMEGGVGERGGGWGGDTFSKLSPYELASKALVAMHSAGDERLDYFARSHAHSASLSATSAPAEAVRRARIARSQQLLAARVAVSRSLVAAFDSPPQAAGHHLPDHAPPHPPPHASHPPPPHPPHPPHHLPPHPPLSAHRPPSFKVTRRVEHHGTQRGQLSFRARSQMTPPVTAVTAHKSIPPQLDGTAQSPPHGVTVDTSSSNQGFERSPGASAALIDQAMDEYFNKDQGSSPRSANEVERMHLNTRRALPVQDEKISCRGQSENRKPAQLSGPRFSGRVLLSGRSRPNDRAVQL
ncbi:MAG: hypothetical protein SGPRY_006866, partial [Prymnesium sp.]